MSNQTKPGTGEHTPLPWRAGDTDNRGWRTLYDADGKAVAEAFAMMAWQAGTAERIVRSVNLLPEALRTLEDSLDLLRAIVDQGALKHVAHLRDGGDVLREDCHEQIARARAVLAKAKEEGR